MSERNNDKLLNLVVGYINQASTKDLEVLYAKIYVELLERGQVLDKFQESQL
jgi:hypothetical protein